MKAIKIIIDDNLLERFDADPDVSRYGRSAVLAQTIREFLASKEPKPAKSATGPGTRKRAKAKEKAA